MRRAVFFILGVFELAVAGLLVTMGCQLPREAEVTQSFAQAGRVTARANDQVGLFRKQITGVRRLEWKELAGRMQSQTGTVTRVLKAQRVDFDTVGTMRDALGDVSRGLTSLAETLDPDLLGKLGTGLGETATFFEDKLLPGAQQAADGLEKTTAALRVDAKQLGELLRQAPLDLKAVRAVHDGLGAFGKGLERLDASLKLQRLGVMKEGFEGMEEALTTGADQVERLARFSYPVVTVRGLKMDVDKRPFWPEGGKIAEGMRKAARGADAAKAELTEVAADLPRLQASLGDTRKIVDQTREALGLALKQQDKIEPLLRDIPNQTARLVEELPKIGGDLARLLRDTQRFKEVAAALRQAQKGLDATTARWPELRNTLTSVAKALTVTRRQLDQALHHRRQYEEAMQQTVLLAETFATMLPLFTDQIDSRLEEEDQALEDLGKSLDDVQQTLPAYEQMALRLLTTGKWLLGLVAGIVALHGGHLLLSAGFGRKYSF